MNVKRYDYVLVLVVTLHQRKPTKKAEEMKIVMQKLCPHKKDVLEVYP